MPDSMLGTGEYNDEQKGHDPVHEEITIRRREIK